MSSDNARPAALRVEPTAPGAKVTRLELFYDLVFVYAFINVTNALSKRLGPDRLLGSLLVLALLWFAWSSFVALGNTVRADQGMMPLVGFATMAVIFMLAMTLPDAFTDEPPGLPGDFVFAVCYLLLRALQVLAFRYSTRHDPELRRGWRRLSPPSLISGLLLLVAALVPHRLFHDGTEFRVRVGLWVLAVVIEYGAIILVRSGGLDIVSAGHWAERHAQIILVALGESIISLGMGPILPAGLPLTWSLIGASALGFTGIIALWWAYFDAISMAGERVLHRTHGPARIRLARDAYTYLHLPMIAGIILFALGLKRILAEIADPAVPSDQDLLGGIELYSLYGGVILYLVALVSFQLRTTHRTDPFQIVEILLLAALIPMADRLPAFAAMALLVLATAAILAIQMFRSHGRREKLRRSVLEERRALEAEETQWRREHF